MEIDRYIAPQNRGWQGWNVAWSNVISGDHDYNFHGFCMAMVVHWLLGIVAEDEDPEAYGRSLVAGTYSNEEIRQLSRSPTRYYGQTDTNFIQNESAQLLTVSHQANHTSASSMHAHIAMLEIRAAGQPSFRLGDPRRRFGAVVSVVWEWSYFHPARYIAGTTAAHAIGFYFDGNAYFFLDPNRGLGRFNRLADRMTFFHSLWSDYKAHRGSVHGIYM